ncbi:glycosyltransferase [Actinokineospora sp.]|uniref:glycosyltransferase n=1 Tax=Actinokineospora sp. TaxID=1872133 RepID=UPI004037EC09
MRAVIVTTGTQGDVSPYTGIGTRLRDAGIDVTIVTHKVFGDFVGQCGLDFDAIPGDPRELVSSGDFQTWERTQYSVRALRHQVRRVRNVVHDVAAMMDSVADGLAEAVPDDADILLLSGTASPLAYHLAEARGLPSMGVYWGPTEPTAAFPPTMAGARSMGSLGNRVAGEAGLRITYAAYKNAVRRLRANLGLGPAGLRAVRRRQRTRQWPVHHGFSPVIFPRPPDWRQGMEVVGYWWPCRPRDWQPPNELIDFIHSDTAPVFVGLGSMATDDARQVSALAARALRLAGVRGVIQSGWSDLSVSGDDLMTIGPTPHDWLFPRMRAIVHHAGAGTTGAALRSGVPMVTVPVTIDQPFWASRTADLGVGPAPIPFCTLTADALANAIQSAVTETGYRERAFEVARQVEAEDGAGRVLDAVTRLVG